MFQDLTALPAFLIFTNLEFKSDLGLFLTWFLGTTVLFLKKIIYFNQRLITILWWVLPYIDMNQSRVYMCPSILNPPPHPIPLGCPRAPALGALLHAYNLHWSSILNVVIYMFQCYFLKSSHPLLLPNSPKVCYLHLCLFCYLEYRAVSTIFQNFIYMH